jgi:hypothetical protein
MLKLRRQSQLDKAKASLREVVSYADSVVRDEALRADLLAAVGHGAEMSGRVRKDVDAVGIRKRLANDGRLRKELRAAIDDIDSAGNRLRRRRDHRRRNVVLIVAGVGAVAAIVPAARHWLTNGAAEGAASGVMPANVAA